MQKICRAAALGLLFALMPALAFAQGRATLQGRVVNAETGEPLQGANVFIAKSMKGTVADADGRYRLEGIPLGAQRLYVSMVGFEPEFRDLNLREAAAQTIDFSLKPAILSTPEIVLEGEADPKWKQRLERFTRLFIGETPNSAETKIMNPEVLDFEEKLQFFRASAPEPLIIENRALGYRVKYFLKDFEAEPSRIRYDGEPLFEELEPDSPEQQIMWEANRKKAFYGSFRHFALALYEGRLEEHGWMIYHHPPAGPGRGGVMGAMAGARGPRFQVKEKDILKEGEQPMEKTLDFPGEVEVIYTNEQQDPTYRDFMKRWSGTDPGRNDRVQNSAMKLEKGPTAIDYKGDTVDPYGVTVMGYFAFERVADDVPKEYRPGR